MLLQHWKSQVDLALDAFSGREKIGRDRQTDNELDPTSLASKEVLGLSAKLIGT